MFTNLHLKMLVYITSTCALWSDWNRCDSSVYMPVYCEINIRNFTVIMVTTFISLIVSIEVLSWNFDGICHIDVALASSQVCFLFFLNGMHCYKPAKCNHLFRFSYILDGSKYIVSPILIGQFRYSVQFSLFHF